MNAKAIDTWIDMMRNNVSARMNWWDRPDVMMPASYVGMDKEKLALILMMRFIVSGLKDTIGVIDAWHEINKAVRDYMPEAETLLPTYDEVLYRADGDKTVPLKDIADGTDPATWPINKNRQEKDWYRGGNEPIDYFGGCQSGANSRFDDGDRSAK